MKNKTILALVLVTFLTVWTISAYALSNSGKWMWTGIFKGEWNIWQQTIASHKQSWNENWIGYWNWQWKGNNSHYGNGQGNGDWKNSIIKDKEWKWMGKWLWKNNHSTYSTGVISLSKSDIENFQYQYSEEMLARDVYKTFYDLYKVKIFNNIAQSEQKHMDSVKNILERVNATIPTDYGVLNDTFIALKTEGSKGLQQALEVWLKIEMLDIDDIKDTLSTSNNVIVNDILYNIGGASYNHLRWFSKALIKENFITNIDISKYLSNEDINTKWSLKGLLK